MIMQNVGIQIGTVTVSWYGLFIVLGILAGTALGYLLVCFSHLKFDDFIQIACFTGLGAMAGAKLLYLIVSWQKIDFTRITDPEYLNALLGGGFVFYGGLAGGLLGLYLCGKILHIPVVEYARSVIPVIPLAHAFGRIGCAVVGCCYGVPYDGPGAVVYTESIAAPTGIPLFPVQAVEAAGNLVLTAVLCGYIIFCKKKGKKAKSVQLYLVLYAVFRFVLEFMRYDDGERGIIFGLSTSQWISILICAGVIAVVIFGKKKETVKKV
ncbi:MAG TPA: prolipoprotein diacylglyceryl transferase [Candidatus Mediterraneibacter surreyensis]|nr:prolipoprotein diacylglyceryl transferase [Candidatus Mediterraneibacter surreyensis]